ncbi:eukaryotic translation initiation factor 3 subunit C [Sitodiplosis mosellana]|uniref:eukaryotic translation initiation factor 3 subunit C n=1 Tax=Sitodiplosis mosellana TaxID=263140 RepID=UPI0024448B37|nr:eukaryotic translation initiation factor 3 subunit C [Sitodiplosis mosellana]
MSRFFATGGSDSESDTDSEKEQIVSRPAPAAFTFSDEEEEVKRVVRSMKEKRYEDLTNIIKNIRNYRKIKDMSNILQNFEDLTRAHQKALPVISKEENGVTPRFYVRALAELEDFINEVWEDREGRRNLSKNNSKAFGPLRQKFRKYVKDFEADLAKFRESPDDEDEPEEEKVEEESESSEDERKAPKAVSFKKEEKKAPKEADDSDDSSFWGSDSESDSDSSEEETQYVNIRERFLKKTTEKEDKDDEEKKKKRKEKEVKPRKQHEGSDDEGGWETVTKGSSTTAEKPKMFAKDAEIDVPLVLNKLNEIMASRGKKRTDRRQQIDLLFELKQIAQLHNLGDAIACKIRFNIVSAVFDYNPKVNEPMKLEYWSKLLDVMNDLVTLLLSSEDITLSESINEEQEEYEKAPFKLRGCVLTAVERLDDEFTKLLKECDPHSNEYVDRLKDEIRVTTVIEQVLQYIERVGGETEICRVYLRKIDHLYYKFDPNVLKKKNKEIDENTVTSVNVMEKLCRYIYAKDQTDRLRTRAILSHIYHHALHDNWFQARDLLLMSHLQENIQHSDPPTQILYNRMMANLGLCAFRQGSVKDAHQCLVDLMMTGKPKELLAQGLLPQRQHERSPEQEKVEKQRQMPFHMHINLELLECVYLVSAMLLEIPYMAAHEFDARRRMISKTFYQQLRSSERQSLVGPPESMREHVVAAAKAMRCGNWSACATFIVNKKMNTKVWDLFYEADRVRDMLTKFIKEESLRTYLFTYSNVYSSISMPSLADMFDLALPKVHSVISKMIINEELMASLDDPTDTVVMHRSEPSRLQALSMQLVDKVTNLVDANERIFEVKQGTNFYQRGNQNKNFNFNKQQQRGNYRNQNQGGYNRRNQNNHQQDRGDWNNAGGHRNRNNRNRNQNNQYNNHQEEE